MNRAQRRSSRTPFAAAIACVAVTILATVVLKRTVDERDAIRFQHAVESTQDRIQGRLDTYIELLVGTRGLFAASTDVTAEEFAAYVSRADVQRRYPGIQGIGFTLRMTPEEKPVVEAQMRRQQLPDFRVWPDHPGNEYHAITFLEPRDRRNAAAFGYDMYSEPVRREAMDRARDQGTPAASGKVTLVQEIDPRKQAGFLIYVPHYKEPWPTTVEARSKALVGFIYSPFRADDLFAGVFGREKLPDVSFEVYDGGDVLPEALMHRSARTPGHHSQFEITSTMDVAGRPWAIVIRSEPSFETLSSRGVVPMLSSIGLMASLLVFFMTRSLAQARMHAEAAHADAKAQRDNLHRLFMQAPAAVAIVHGRDMRYVLANPLHEQWVGRHVEVDTRIADVLPEADARELIPRIQHVLENGEPFVVSEVPVHLKSAEHGERLGYLNGAYQPLRGPDGKVDGVMSLAYEVTEMVEARHRVESLAEDLRKAVLARDDFLSIAGHELRTPLSALMLQLQGLRRVVAMSPAALDGNGLVGRLDKALASVERLERLINELLDVSRITAGRVQRHVESVDLAALAMEIAERFSEQAARSGTTLTVNAPCVIVGQWDRARLDQVITNLMSNAIKYGGGQPVIVSLEEHVGGVRIQVRDHGIGISPADRQRIFQRFERAVSGRHYGGLGLGLWISQQIVEALGGRIDVEDVDGPGTLFVVQLPKRCDKAAA